MKSVYIINVQMTGASGGVIHFVESAYLHVEKAIEVLEKMNTTYVDDPNYEAYIVGPVLLNES